MEISSSSSASWSWNGRLFSGFLPDSGHDSAHSSWRRTFHRGISRFGVSCSRTLASRHQALGFRLEDFGRKTRELYAPDFRGILAGGKGQFDTSPLSRNHKRSQGSADILLLGTAGRESIPQSWKPTPACADCNTITAVRAASTTDSPLKSSATPRRRLFGGGRMGSWGLASHDFQKPYPAGASP